MLGCQLWVVPLRAGTAPHTAAEGAQPVQSCSCAEGFLWEDFSASRPVLSDQSVIVAVGWAVAGLVAAASSSVGGFPQERCSASIRSLQGSLWLHSCFGTP